MASVFRSSYVSGSSETFYGNVLSHSATPLVEADPQRSPEFAGLHSTSPSGDLRIDWQDDTDSCQQMYRRMSGYMGSAQETEETVNVVECASTGTSFFGNCEIEEIVGVGRGAEGQGMYFGGFATSDESLLKFEMLNPTLYLWPSIYEYVESVDRLGEPIEVAASGGAEE